MCGRTGIYVYVCVCSVLALMENLCYITAGLRLGAEQQSD